MKKYLVFLYAFLCINLLRCSDGKPVLLPGNIGFIEEKNDIMEGFRFLPPEGYFTIEKPSFQLSKGDTHTFIPVDVDIENENGYKLYCLTAYNDMAYIASFFHSIHDESPFKTITLKLFPAVQHINKELNSPIAKEQLRKDTFLLIKDIGYFCCEVKTECESYESGDSSYHKEATMLTKISPLVAGLRMKFESFIEKNKPKFDSKCPSKSIMMMESLCIVYLLICCWQIEVCGKQGFSFGLQRIAALVGAGLCTFYLLDDIKNVYSYVKYSQELEAKKKYWFNTLNTTTCNKENLIKFNNIQKEISKDIMGKIEIQTNQPSSASDTPGSRITVFSTEDDYSELDDLLNDLVSPT